jgi:hypothetical protein
LLFTLSFDEGEVDDEDGADDGDFFKACSLFSGACEDGLLLLFEL